MASPAELAAFYQRDQDIRNTEERLARLRAMRQQASAPPPFSGGASSASPSSAAAAAPFRSAHPTTEELYMNTTTPDMRGDSPPSFISVPPPSLAPILTDSFGRPIGAAAAASAGSPNAAAAARARDASSSQASNDQAAAAALQLQQQQQRAEQEAAVRAAVASAQPGAVGPISASPPHLLRMGQPPAALSAAAHRAQAGAYAPLLSSPPQQQQPGVRSPVYPPPQGYGNVAASPVPGPAGVRSPSYPQQQQQQQQQYAVAGPPQDAVNTAAAGLLLGQNHRGSPQEMPARTGPPPGMAGTAAPSGLTPLQESMLIGTSNLAIGDPLLAQKAVRSPAFHSGTGSGLGPAPSSFAQQQQGVFANPDAAEIAATLAAAGGGSGADNSDDFGMADLGQQPSLAIDPDSNLAVPDLQCALPMPPPAVLMQLHHSTRPDMTSSPFAGGSGSGSSPAASGLPDASSLTLPPPVALGVATAAAAASRDSVASQAHAQNVFGASMQKQHQQQQQQQMQQFSPPAAVPARDSSTSPNRGGPVVPPIALGSLSGGSPYVHPPPQQQQMQSPPKDRLTAAMEAAMGFGGGSQPSSGTSSARGGSQVFNMDDVAASAHVQNGIAVAFGSGHFERRSNSGNGAGAAAGNRPPSVGRGDNLNATQAPGAAAAQAGYHYNMHNPSTRQHQAAMLPSGQKNLSLGDMMSRYQQQQQPTNAPPQQQQQQQPSQAVSGAAQQQQQYPSAANATTNNGGSNNNALAANANRQREQEEQLRQRLIAEDRQHNNSNNDGRLSSQQQTQQPPLTQQQQLQRKLEAQQEQAPKLERQREEEEELRALAERYGESSPARMLRRLHESERHRLALVREVQSLKEDLKAVVESSNSKPAGSVARNARTAGAQSFDPHSMNENVVVRVRSTDALEGHGAQWAAEIDEEDQARTRAQQVMGEMLRAIDARKAAEVRLQQVSAENERLREQAREAHQREKALHQMLAQYQEAFNKWRGTWADKDNNSNGGDNDLGGGGGGGGVLLGKSAGLSTVRVQILESRVEALTKENEKLRSDMNIVAARRKAEEDAEASRLALRGSNAASFLNVTSTKGAAALRRRGADQETDVLVRMFELQRQNEGLQHTVNEMKLQRR